MGYCAQESVKITHTRELKAEIDAVDNVRTVDCLIIKGIERKIR